MRAKTLLWVTWVLLTSSAAYAQSDCGPVILAGHDADDHHFESIYAGLYNDVQAGTSNGNNRILAIGASGKALDWIQQVAGLMTSNPPVDVVFGAGINCDFTAYSIIHVPSDSGDIAGGISVLDASILNSCVTQISTFINTGGGLVGLTQGEFLNPFEYIRGVAPLIVVSAPSSGRLPNGGLFDDIEPTAEGSALGITANNLDGCCFHNIFPTHPAFLQVLAFANEPGEPLFDKQPVFIGGSQCVLPFCGDGVLDPGEECDDGNQVDGDGCSALCQLECANQSNDPPVVECTACSLCNDPLECSAQFDCESIAIAADPEGDAVTLSCTPLGPYVVGTTDVVVTADDGVHQVSVTCPVTVNDCEPPICAAPPAIALECSQFGGVPASDPAIQALLVSATAVDNCATPSASAIAPSLFAAGCGAGASSPVVFTTVDDVGRNNFCATEVLVADTTAPSLKVPGLAVLECASPGGFNRDSPVVKTWLDSAEAKDICFDTSITNDAPFDFPAVCDANDPGTIVTFEAMDTCANTTSDTAELKVVDTTPPEVCGTGEVCLWPPNHKYVCFDEMRSRVSVSDVCDPDVQVASIECVSSQCDEAPCDAHPGENGDGNTTDDCVYDEATDTLCARAERAGTDPSGRNYTVTFVVADACGNETRHAGLSIYVPHDDSPHEQCIGALPNAAK